MLSSTGECLGLHLSIEAVPSNNEEQDSRLPARGLLRQTFAHIEQFLVVQVTILLHETRAVLDATLPLPLLCYHVVADSRCCFLHLFIYHRIRNADAPLLLKGRAYSWGQQRHLLHRPALRAAFPHRLFRYCSFANTTVSK
jgi:hypothetical protein